ncbi:hypothetical protein [Moorena producens]|uniref:hypothetical protein n=1 Tax=Moorena producens TaxID=1155739 RepID=UPI001313F774|nr:hypothetical protein [Moorena producens]
MLTTFISGINQSKYLQNKRLQVLAGSREWQSGIEDWARGYFTSFHPQDFHYSSVGCI